MGGGGGGEETNISSLPPPLSPSPLAWILSPASVYVANSFVRCICYGHAISVAIKKLKQMEIHHGGVSSEGCAGKKEERGRRAVGVDARKEGGRDAEGGDRTPHMRMAA